MTGGARPSFAALVALLLAATSETASAQRWFIEPSIATRVAATSNTFLGGPAAESDVIIGVKPQLAIRGDSPGLHVAGAIGVDSVNYTRGTLQNVLLPQGDLLARVTAVERFFFIEGAVRALQTSLDPFGARPSGSSTQNTVTSTQYRISPYIETEPLRGFHLRARSENVKTSQNGAALSLSESVARTYFGHHTASVEQDPRPFGWRIEGDRSSTRFQGEAQPITIDVARAIVNYAIDDTLSFGLRAGAERNNFILTDGSSSSGPIYGGQLLWQPTERTSLSFSGEHRFFGSSWNLTFSHRNPSVAWNVTASRVIDTTPQSLLELPPTDNVAALLDSILTTRFPNPIDRAKQVQDLINLRGLPSSIQSAISIIAPRLSISNTVSATAALLGTTSTLALSVFYARQRDALDTGPLATGTAATNNKQWGGSLAYSRRMSPTVDATFALEYTRIDALDEVLAGGRSKQAGARGQIGVRLDSKSTAQFGVQYRKLGSNIVVSGDETMVFASLVHTF